MFDEDRIRALICWGMVLWLIFLGAVWMAGQGCDTRLQIYRQVMMKWSHSHWKVIGSSIRCCMPCKNSAYKHGQSNIKNILVKFPVKCSRPVCVRESFCCCCFFHITIQTRASVLMRDDFTPHYTWEKTVFWRRKKKTTPKKTLFAPDSYKSAYSLRWHFQSIMCNYERCFWFQKTFIIQMNILDTG